MADAEDAGGEAGDGRIEVQRFSHRGDHQTDVDPVRDGDRAHEKRDRDDAHEALSEDVLDADHRLLSILRPRHGLATHRCTSAGGPPARARSRGTQQRTFDGPVEEAKGRPGSRPGSKKVRTIPPFFGVEGRGRWCQGDPDRVGICSSRALEQAVDRDVIRVHPDQCQCMWVESGWIRQTGFDLEGRDLEARSRRRARPRSTGALRRRPRRGE